MPELVGVLAHCYRVGREAIAMPAPTLGAGFEATPPANTCRTPGLSDIPPESGQWTAGDTAFRLPTMKFPLVRIEWKIRPRRIRLSMTGHGTRCPTPFAHVLQVTSSGSTRSRLVANRLSPKTQGSRPYRAILMPHSVCSVRGCRV